MTWPNLLLTSTAAIVLGALADRLIGDPRRLPHLVRGLGRLIAAVERRLRRRPAPSPAADRRRGLALVATVLAVAALTAGAALAAAYALSPWLGLAVEAAICCQCLAVKSLHDESMAVAAGLADGDLAQARRAVAMIVGRDTAALDTAGVARAAVETVAENTSDGVVAPLLAMLAAGGLGGVLYKAVNTLDSMVGYRDDRYRDFGRAAARLDDAANWLPARLAAGLMVAAAPLAGADARSAWRIWRRDRTRHASPNAGQPEAACAGALHIQLGGPAAYSGVPLNKPVIGGPARPAATPDIAAANRLMSATAWLALALVAGVRLAVWGVVAHATR